MGELVRCSYSSHTYVGLLYMDLSLRVRARSRRGGFAQVMGTAQSSTQVYSYLIVDIYDGIITGAGHGSVCVGVGVYVSHEPDY